MQSVLAILALSLLTAACSDERSTPAPATASAPWFTDVTESSGLHFTHVSGHAQRCLFPEIMCGGVGLLDFDGDNDLDVFCVQGRSLLGDGAAPASQLFENLGGLRFADATQKAGVGAAGYGMGCACADYDGDGDTDLFVTRVGKSSLYRNDGGRFADVTDATGAGVSGWSSSASFFDMEGDGDLDLFVARYIEWTPERELTCRAPDGREDYCHPNAYGAPAASVLLRNDGEHFTDVSTESQIASVRGNALGVDCGDYDGDRRTDVYVACDMTANHLWINAGGGRFREQALLSGCALSGTGFLQSGMGVHAVDLEGDGMEELFVANMRHQSFVLYRRGQHSFVDATARFNLSLATRPYTGFGLGFADFDQDGRLDLFIANGRVAYEAPILDPADPYAEENLLFTLAADGRFAEVSPRGGVSPPLVRTSRGAALGDLDGDGDVDLVVIHRDARASVLRNDAGSRGAWIAFSVLDTNGRVAIGARVRIQADGRSQEREVDPHFGYLSSHDPRVHFGLGSAERVERISVRWPDGREDTWTDLPARKAHILRRSSGG